MSARRSPDLIGAGHDGEHLGNVIGLRHRPVGRLEATDTDRVLSESTLTRLAEVRPRYAGEAGRSRLTGLVDGLDVGGAGIVAAGRVLEHLGLDGPERRFDRRAHTFQRDIALLAQLAADDGHLTSNEGSRSHLTPD